MHNEKRNKFVLRISLVMFIKILKRMKSYITSYSIYYINYIMLHYIVYIL